MSLSKVEDSESIIYMSYMFNLYNFTLTIYILTSIYECQTCFGIGRADQEYLVLREKSKTTIVAGVQQNKISVENALS